MTRTDDLRAGREVEGARALLASAIGADPFERIEELREIGKRKAEAEGVAYQLERERKPLLSRIAAEISRTHAEQSFSEARLERLARADQRYADHIKGTAEAIRRRELAHSEYWAVKSLLEWDRAALAHLNAISRLENP